MEPEAVLAGEQTDELLLCHDELPLQNAVAQRADEAQRHGRTRTNVERQRVPERCMEHVLKRGRVRDYGHGSIRRRTPEQQPGIRLFLFALRQRRGKLEPALVQERSFRRDDCRVARAVEIQAAHVLARPQTEPREAGPGEFGPLCEERFPSGCRIRIVDDRNFGLGQQREAAGPGLRIRGQLSSAATECINRDDDEGG
jgi:hypothetical protein